MTDHHPDSAEAQYEQEVQNEVMAITDIFMRIVAGRSPVVALNIGLTYLGTMASVMDNDQKKFIAEAMKERADLILMPTVTDVEIKETLQ